MGVVGIESSGQGEKSFGTSNIAPVGGHLCTVVEVPGPELPQRDLYKGAYGRGVKTILAGVHQISMALEIEGRGNMGVRISTGKKDKGRLNIEARPTKNRL